jgi:outer membrane beta-barrel protein
MRILTPITFSLVAALAGTAAAQTRPTLTDQPAVRRRFELREGRFEVSPTFEATVQAEFRHTFAGGIKAEYHLTDAISIGGMIFFGASVDTGLMDEIVGTLPNEDSTTDPTPGRTTVEQHANKMPLHGGLGITFTPWFGKMALFGKAFLHYDIYISGGFGFGITNNDSPMDDRSTTCEVLCDDEDPNNNRSTNPRNDGPHNAGFNPGVQWGAGVHLFFNKWVALDISFRNYMFADNPSGFDFDADLDVDDEDRRFLSHLFFGVGISMYFPPRPDISR